MGIYKWVPQTQLNLLASWISNSKSSPQSNANNSNKYSNTFHHWLDGESPSWNPDYANLTRVEDDFARAIM